MQFSKSFRKAVYNYISKFGGPIPAPANIPTYAVEEVLRAHIEKGEPVPPDYDWLQHVPTETPLYNVCHHRLAQHIRNRYMAHLVRKAG